MTSTKDSAKQKIDQQKESCQTSTDPSELYEPITPLKATGKAPVLIEIICERVHCVLYDYAINTVDMIMETFGDKIEVQTVIRQGDREDAKHFLRLCERAGKMLTVPTILINGEAMFTSVPHPSALEAAIQKQLDALGAKEAVRE